MSMRPALAALAATLVTAAPLRGQGISLQMGRLLDDGGWTAYTIGWIQSLPGPLAAEAGATYLRGPGSAASLFGATLDASLFRGGLPGFYVVGGVGGGFGSGAAEPWWRGWSAGVGYELIPTGFFSLGVETRYREMLPAHRAGPEVAFRIATRFGNTNRAAPENRTPRPLAREAARDSDVEPGGDALRSGMPPRLATAGAFGEAPAPATSADAIAADVIRVAEGEIGRRYQLGGTGEPGDGFDCSGLIQFAYARVGIALPRRSVDQARAGREIGTDASALQPGDVLTFSTRGGPVTHVGLYMGDGRFIHSASKGVQISRLGDDDPYGRWWYRRWVGARRVIETR